MELSPVEVKWKILLLLEEKEAVPLSLVNHQFYQLCEKVYEVNHPCYLYRKGKDHRCFFSLRSLLRHVQDTFIFSRALQSLLNKDKVTAIQAITRDRRIFEVRYEVDKVPEKEISFLWEELKRRDGRRFREGKFTGRRKPLVYRVKDEVYTNLFLEGKKKRVLSS